MIRSRILAHRGRWTRREGQNRPESLLGPLADGYGIETDLRDRDGQLVISHDMAGSGSPRLAEVTDRIASAPAGWLALNVKADGLAAACAALPPAVRERAFFFDMAVPDMLGYLRAGLRTFTRHSDLEPTPACYGEAAGVWLDELAAPWITADVIAAHRAHGKLVAIVSGELHGRDHAAHLALFRRFAGDPGVLVCTDHPRDYSSAVIRTHKEMRR